MTFRFVSKAQNAPEACQVFLFKFLFQKDIVISVSGYFQLELMPLSEVSIISSVTKLGDLLDFGQLFKASGKRQFL